MIFAEHVKNHLLSLIQEMAAVPWLFSKNLPADFSRSRKLDFTSTIQFILSMESGSLKKENSLLIHLLLQLLASREANCFRRHSNFCFMNLILFFHFKRTIMAISCWPVMALI